MVQKVKEQISVSIKGRVFDLVWETDQKNFHACDRCALLGEVCKGSMQSSLLTLCSTIVEEPETWFMESSNKIQVHGINNQEITISALASLRDAEKKIGNHSRAKVAQSLIDQIG